MARPAPSQKEFSALLPVICGADTSLDQSGWRKENPLWGHCAVVSLLAQELFGGSLMRASLEHVPEFSHMRSHYANRLPSCGIVDFTATQFGDNYPEALVWTERERDYLLGDMRTRKRYELLKARFESVR